MKTGGLALDSSELANVAAHADVWEKVIRKVEAGMMPPAGVPRPDAATRKALVANLEGVLDRDGRLIPRLTVPEARALIKDGTISGGMIPKTETALAALEKGRPGEEYFLAGDNRSLNDLFSVIGRLTGVTFPVRHLSFATGKMYGALEVARARLFNHRPKLTPGVVEIFKHDWVYSSDKACRELGYRVVPLEEGIQKTLEAGRG